MCFFKEWDARSGTTVCEYPAIVVRTELMGFFSGASFSMSPAGCYIQERIDGRYMGPFKCIQN